MNQEKEVNKECFTRSHEKEARIGTRAGAKSKYTKGTNESLTRVKTRSQEKETKECLASNQKKVTIKECFAKVKTRRRRRPPSSASPGARRRKPEQVPNPSKVPRRASPRAKSSSTRTKTIKECFTRSQEKVTISRSQEKEAEECTKVKTRSQGKEARKRRPKQVSRPSKVPMRMSPG